MVFTKFKRYLNYGLLFKNGKVETSNSNVKLLLFKEFLDKWCFFCLKNYLRWYFLNGSKKSP